MLITRWNREDYGAVLFRPILRYGFSRLISMLGSNKAHSQDEKNSDILFSRVELAAHFGSGEVSYRI